MSACSPKITFLRCRHDRLLHTEMELRRQLEAVAAFRRELPAGDEVRDARRLHAGHRHGGDRQIADRAHRPTRENARLVPPQPEQGRRHVDSIWSIWNVLDLTPEGRGTDWNPKLDY